MCRIGKVKVAIDVGFVGEEKQVATMSRGQFFGEVALMKEDLRTANVYAIDTVVCYVLERKAFTNLIGNLAEAKKETDIDASTENTPKRTVNPLVKRAKIRITTLNKNVLAC